MQVKKDPTEPRKMAKRDRASQTKRCVNEQYFETLTRMQEWGRRRRVPFKGLMLQALVPFCRKHKIKLASRAELADMEVG